uniref:Uncharacterized protein n=1 Tax=Anguilla anguilla TaxID=7936 RepID=A0A0E9QMQ6_ANGAN
MRRLKGGSYLQPEGTSVVCVSALVFPPSPSED